MASWVEGGLENPTPVSEEREREIRTIIQAVLKLSLSFPTLPTLTVIKSENYCQHVVQF